MNDTDTNGLVFSATLLLLCSPYLLVFCGKYGYLGLVKGRIHTHLGIHAGWIARLYGAFYLLIFAATIFGLVMVMPGFLSLGFETIFKYLIWPVPAQPDTGLVFIGLGVLFIVMGWLIIKVNIRFKPSYANNHAHIRTTRVSMCVFSFECFVIGLLAFFNSAQVLYLLAMSSPLYIISLLQINLEGLNRSGLYENHL